MKRLGSKQETPLVIQPPKPNQEVPWHWVPGMGGWLIYKLSRYIPLPQYPITMPKVKKRKFKMHGVLNLCKLVGHIGVLELHAITEIQGYFRKFTLDSIKVKDCDVVEEIWDIIKMASIVVLEDSNIRLVPVAYLSRAVSLDILGSSVGHLAGRFEELVKTRRRRIRVDNNDVLIFWDEYKGCVCALRHYPAAQVLLRHFPLVHEVYFRGMEITHRIINSLQKHFVRIIKFYDCSISPLKIYDLYYACKDSLQEVEFHRTTIPLAAAEYLQAAGVAVKVANPRSKSSAGNPYPLCQWS
ncbi:hypothetical protein NEHOM01_1766 [Nematocida homosporus]|uniref:uncharacterized protein n=1 Tax=Nematocida homosporus TaxID=1912981 RepID=UPI00222008D2|nr:uncharacterized protein NEHOM01_1766 [Nematocida homosporus]KAI5186877.1 hypothetical protein NEHOM01_1766 [Nematocida homosporus]